MRRLTCLISLALAFPGGAWAEPTTHAGSDIIVTGQGQGLSLPPGDLAYGSVIIDHDALSDGASGRVENVLLNVAGFQQFRRSDSRSANPSAQGATLRALGGNASSRTLVVLDGVPMADPFFGYIPFNALVADRLGMVRLTRGGGVSAFGAGAVAGTIELMSATRDDLPIVAGGAFYGSHDSTELSASVTPNLGSGYVSLSGRWDRSDGFYTTPKNQRVAATAPAAYDHWSAGLRAVAPLSSEQEIQFRALVFRDDRTLRFAGADSGSKGQDVSVRFLSRGAWQVDALAYIQARDFSNIVISSGSFRKVLDQRATPSTGIGGKIEVRPPIGGGHVMRLGVDTRIAKGDMYEDAYAFDGSVRERRHATGRQNTTGVFIQNDWTLGKLVLTGGARLDYWSITNGSFDTIDAFNTGIVYPDRHDWRTSFRAGGLLHVSYAATVRVAGYTGWRLPTLNELYRPFTVFPVVTQANAALAPEKLKGVEAGIDLIPAPGVMLGFTAFYNRLDNAIANVTIGTNLRQRRNVDAVVAKGVELMASAQMSPSFSLQASYAYSHSTVRAPGQAFNGLMPAQSPRHAASGTMSWSSDQGLNLAATARYTGKQYEDDLQSNALRDAFTLDAIASYPLGHGARLVVRGENITDTKVVTRNADGAIDLGVPRTLWIGARFAY